MEQMRLVVVGAAGRMGRMLVKAIAANAGRDARRGAGAQRFAGARPRRRRSWRALGPLGVKITDDPLNALLNADGVIDFSAPAVTVEIAALAAQARIVHVIGTTGLSADDLAKLDAAARHATIVRSGNMSLGVNLLAGLVKKVAATLGADWDIEIVEMHHRMKVDAPSGTALLLGEAAAAGREVALADKQRARPRRPHRRAQAGRHRFRDAARRHAWSATTA